MTTPTAYFFLFNGRRVRMLAEVATDDAKLRATYALINNDWADPALFDVQRRTVNDGIEVSFVAAGSVVSSAPEDDTTEITQDEDEPAGAAGGASEVDPTTETAQDQHEPAGAAEDDGTTETAQEQDQPAEAAGDASEADATSRNAQGEHEPDVAAGDASEEDDTGGNAQDETEPDATAGAAPERAALQAEATGDDTTDGSDDGAADPDDDPAPGTKTAATKSTTVAKQAEPTAAVLAEGKTYRLPVSHCKTDKGLLTSLASRAHAFAQHDLWTVERGDVLRVVPAKISRYLLELNGERHELAPEVASVEAHLKAFIAEAAPRMADAHIERNVKNGEMVIRLVKMAGTKGSQAYARAIAVLDRAPSSLNPVIALHDAVSRAQARGRLNIATTLQLAVRIRSALARGQREHEQVNRLIKQLDASPAQAASRVPAGF